MIHFTSDDLARIRVAPSPDPLWELVMGLNKISGHIGGGTYNSWRSFARNAMVDQRSRPRRRRGAVNIPDIAGPHDVEAAVATIMNSPSSPLRRGLEIATRGRARQPRNVQASERGVGDILITYYQWLLQPFWPTVQAHVSADRSLRIRAVLDGGGEALLNSLRPTLHWNSPTLHAEYPADREVHLKGSGLMLAPSYFCWQRPLLLTARNRPVPVLFYPIDHDRTASDTVGPRGPEQALGALIGRTRSQILLALAQPHTTGELAVEFGVSAASISQHTSVLRAAGLITTRREANIAIHGATDLGIALYR
jgi:DNA-binding transcriptional ArsR family regulator